MTFIIQFDDTPLGCRLICRFPHRQAVGVTPPNDSRSRTAQASTERSVDNRSVSQRRVRWGSAPRRRFLKRRKAFPVGALAGPHRRPIYIVRGLSKPCKK